MMGVQSIRANAFGRREQAILERLASQIAPAIENADLYHRLQANSAEIAVVDEVSRIITSTLDVDNVYHQFFHELKTIVARALRPFRDPDGFPFRSGNP